MRRKTGELGKALIKKSESFEKATYICPAGVPTIGYGTTKIDGKPVPMGMTITKEQAEKLLEDDLLVFENAVNKFVRVEITQNQFDALISFVYNVGIGNFSNSTLLRVLNQGNYTEAADQILRWTKAKGKELPGLVKRRDAERQLFLKE